MATVPKAKQMMDVNMGIPEAAKQSLTWLTALARIWLLAKREDASLAVSAGVQEPTASRDVPSLSAAARASLSCMRRSLRNHITTASRTFFTEVVLLQQILMHALQPDVRDIVPNVCAVLLH